MKKQARAIPNGFKWKSISMPCSVIDMSDYVYVCYGLDSKTGKWTKWYQRHGSHRKLKHMPKRKK